MPVPNTPKIGKTSYSRVFIQRGEAAPNVAPAYQSIGRIMGLDWSQGDLTPVRVHSSRRYDAFDIVDTIKGDRGLPSTSVEFYRALGFSDVLAMVKEGCPVTIYANFGACATPDDFNGGWRDGHKIVLSAAGITNYSTPELGALGSDQRAATMETIAVTAMDLYQIKPILALAQAESLITDEVIDTAICDAISCGECGLPSSGADVVFGLVGDSSGSPGLPAKVIYTSDGGATWASSPITSLGLAESPSAMTCVGSYLVVVSNASNSHHYIKIADIIAGLGGWTEVTGGYVVSGEPNDLWSVSSSVTYVVGNGGYIYLMSSPTDAVTVLSAGGATTQNLNAVHGVDTKTLVIVGASNTVLYTDNAGDTFQSVTGPAAGIANNAIYMQTKDLWFVGNGSGNLYYTLNAGTDWTQKTFGATAGGAITDIVFVTREVGYMAWNDTPNNRGYVYRTNDGGYSWYRLPEGTFTWPTVRRVNALAVPDAEGQENVVYAAALASDANDGVLLKVA